MASLITNAAAEGLIDGSIDWENDTFKARICVAGSPDQDVTAMTGFTAAAGSTDADVDNAAIVKDDGTNRVALDCDNFAWAASGETDDVVCIAVYKDGLNDAARLPICFIDVTDQPMTGVTSLSYAVPADGLAYLQQ